MTFLRAWLMIVFGMALMLATAGLTWVLGEAVKRLTGSEWAGFAVSLLMISAISARFMSLPHDARIRGWIVRQLTAK